MTDAEEMDVSAALSADGRRLTVAVINPTEETKQLELNVPGTDLTDRARRWVLSGKSRWSHNRPGEPRGVDIQSDTLPAYSGLLVCDPLSVTLFEIAIK
jgi:alpha-N-arabinofuranosidase